MATLGKIVLRRALATQRLQAALVVVAAQFSIQPPQLGRDMPKNVQPDLWRVMELEEMATLLEAIAGTSPAEQPAGESGDDASSQESGTDAQQAAAQGRQGAFQAQVGEDATGVVIDPDTGEQSATVIEAPERVTQEAGALVVTDDPNAPPAPEQSSVEAGETAPSEQTPGSPSMLDGTVEMIELELQLVNDPAVVSALRRTELEGKNRVGVLKALDKRWQALQDASREPS